MPVHVQTVPGLADVVSGRAKLSDIREVSLEDLLGRDPVPPNQKLIETNIEGKVVLVSGAGGSIGSELSRQIIRQKPEILVLFEFSEFSLYRCEQELLSIKKRENISVTIIPILGSVQDSNRIKSVLKRFKVRTVFHAAAYKHVPMVEQNIVEGVRNNVFGTLSILESSIEAEVHSFILVSTDKAVRPTNIMGASKRLAELICQAYAMKAEKTIISMVRFGNVLGSSGSVIPLFHQQISSGGPITVTHPEITRYFMTIPEASQLVIQASAMAEGGEVFVLNMGEPVKILDLAIRMAKLHGFEPRIQSSDLFNYVCNTKQENFNSPTNDKHGMMSNGDVSIVFTGLRSGEKLYEELLISGNPRESSHPLIMVANEDFLELEDLKLHLNQLSSACDIYRVDCIISILKQAGTGYETSSFELVDCFGA